MAKAGLRRTRDGAAEDSWASSTCSVSPAGCGASSHLSSQPSHRSVPTSASPKPSLPPHAPIPLSFPVRATSTTETHPPPLPAPSLPQNSPQNSPQRWHLQELLTPEPSVPKAIRRRAKGWRLGNAPRYLPPTKCYSQLPGFPAQTSTCGLGQLGDAPPQHSSPVCPSASACRAEWGSPWGACCLQDPRTRGSLSHYLGFELGSHLSPWPCVQKDHHRSVWVYPSFMV